MPRLARRSITRAQLQRHDLAELLAAERRELDDVVEAVDELGLEVLEQRLAQRRRRSGRMFEVMISTVFLKSTVRPWPSVRRPSSSTASSVLKTSGWAFSISSSSTTRVGAPAHRLGQLAALVVADVAGRRADQARDACGAPCTRTCRCGRSRPGCRRGTRRARARARSCRRRSGRGRGTSRSGGRGRRARRASGGSPSRRPRPPRPGR